MHTDIYEYMGRSQAERQAHLRLDEPCVEIGGASQEFRGLLAHHLGTTVPRGKKTCLCHACHNPACSNPRHLYWGTASENLRDSIANGDCRNIRQLMIAKYGVDGAREISRRAGSAPKTQYRVSVAIAAKRIARSDIIRKSGIDLTQRGWVGQVANLLGITPAHVRDWMRRHCPDLLATAHTRRSPT